MINILRDLKPGDLPLQPEAAALYKQRAADLFKDNPLVRCLPAGVPRLNAYTHPYKIVQTPGLIVVLYESLTMFRPVSQTAAAFPKILSRLGWVIQSAHGRETRSSFIRPASTTRAWLDGSGHPHTDAMPADRTLQAS